MGGPKALVELDGEPLVRRAVAEALRNTRKHADEGAVVRFTLAPGPAGWELR